MQTRSFWLDKKVLITGVHGFVGSNLCKSLINDGAIVYGIYKNSSYESLLRIEEINNYNSVNINSLDLEKISDLINDKEIEICFHLAAQVEVLKAFEFPYDTFNNNINSTLILCEALRKSSKIKSVILTSTDKIYGDIDKSKLPYLEKYIPQPKHPYEVSKLICENICKCYFENFGLPMIIARPCNLYGPGQLNYSTLIPSLIKSALIKESFIPRSNGLLLRDYMFIEDWIKTLKIVAKKSIKNNKFGEIYNFGANNPYSVKEITKLIFDKIDSKKTKSIIKKFENYESQNEILYQSLNSDKAKKDFNFKIFTNIDVGLEKTINWYKKNQFNIM